MQKLIDVVQDYAQGSHTTLVELYGIANPDSLPTAELWMGTHPKSNSQILAADGQPCLSREMISAGKTALLGDRVATRSGGLPFLFRVPCAARPFSIQVYPSKQVSGGSFARENAAGIPLPAAERNYKDPNHKPELVFALTPLLAVNAFRELSEIVTLLQPMASARPTIDAFLQQPGATHLSQLFADLLNVQGEEKAKALQALRDVLAHEQGELWQIVHLTTKFYPDDSGLPSPLLLNVVKLNPGEAMSLFAETPHVYLQGVTLGVTTNPNNVLHVGLTPKYIDIPKLVTDVKFEARPAGELLTQPQRHGAELDFPIPVGNFTLPLHDLSAGASGLAQANAAIIFCIDSETALHEGDQSLAFKPGESAFVAVNESPARASGRGHVAHVFNKLQ